MALSEDALKGAGLSDWDPKSHLTDMWEVMHHCQDAGLEQYNTQTIVELYIFFKEHNVATVEEFLHKLDECAEKKDFYEFSKYCIGLYRQVHEKQLTEETDPRDRVFIRERMAGAIRMDQLGDRYHQDPKNDHWQRRATINGLARWELPRSYWALLRDYRNLQECMADHREFDKRVVKSEHIQTPRNGIAQEVHHTLNH